MKYLLFNPHSGCGGSKAHAEKYRNTLSEESVLLDVTEIQSYNDFLRALAPEDEIVFFGGDGTLNRFINATDTSKIKNSVYFFPSGSGNDFATDIGKKDTDTPFLINDYIKDLPTVTVKGKSYKFLNGVGFGIDGYCCEVGDKVHAAGKTPDYTMIAVTGLLFHFKPVTATVTVDGVEQVFKKVWIAPTMFGGHYGGGMMPTPGQDRAAEEKSLSTLLFYGAGRIPTLMMFPGIFTGEHVKHEKNVSVLRGKTVTVKFDSPRSLQIDGETFLDVTEYTASI